MAATPRWNTKRFENAHQIGGIQLARLAPAFGGDVDRGVQTAIVNTGSPLRFNVALDRGGDIVDATFNQHSLAYLTANGLKPPSHAYHRDFDWLHNWAGGLLTTCGPHAIGGPHEADGMTYGLHGHYSNTPAKLEMVVNPDLHRDKTEMLLSMTVRTSRVFGPVFEIRRQIQCRLGSPTIVMFDQVTNRGDQPVEHHWLYHVNFGYPLLDVGARFIYRGKAEYWQVPDPPDKPLTQAAMNKLKHAAGGLSEHAGTGERSLVVEPTPDRKSNCHVGIINDRLGLGVELEYPIDAMPRLANWQHYGPNGCYVTGVEPFNGSLMGLDNDSHPKAKVTLKPNQTARYQITIKVHATSKDLAAFAKHDGTVTRA